MNNTMPHDAHNFTVSRVVTQSPSTKTIYVTTTDCNLPTFTPGQFITIYVPELGVEGKAYSLSSAPHEDAYAITVKAMGAFSRHLCSRQVGDVVLGSHPYGFFYTETPAVPLVLVAGGIGVAPFRSLIAHTLHTNPARSITLLHSASTEDELTFSDEFVAWSQAHPTFTYQPYVTKQAAASETVRLGRIPIAEVLAANTETTEFLLCGSISFVRDYWQALREAGVAEERILTEAFFK